MRTYKNGLRRDMIPGMADDEIQWMSTGEAARRLGVTVRTLYRLIDEAQLPAYKFGRVIRLQETEIDAFIKASRIAPGSLEHLYPESRKDTSETDAKLR
jgi:excisionase family DNA binding protein